jgi:hypothetical protein
MILDRVPQLWPGATVVVAATGPSLTPEVAAQCREHRAIAVNDAWRLLPWADVLYSADAPWWTVHKGVPDFAGARWSAHDTVTNNKRDVAERYHLHLVAGKAGDTFSTDPGVIHYGGNSGFQAINLALLFGAARIVLVGFDMRVVETKRHFFGDHPKPLRNSIDYRYFVPTFTNAARHLPAGVEILNATPESALTCFRYVPLEQALACRESVAA